MAGTGGKREGSGAKKNQHRIAIGELRRAIEEKMGIPYVEMLASTHEKLFNDFIRDHNVKEYIRFTETIARRLVEEPVVELNISQPLEDLSDAEIQGRIDNLLTREALSSAHTTHVEPTVVTVVSTVLNDTKPDGSQKT